MSEKATEAFDAKLSFRMSQYDLDVFIAKSQNDIGVPYQALFRDFISAFNDGRLRIVPTEDQKRSIVDQKKSLKSLGELYVTGK